MASITSIEAITSIRNAAFAKLGQAVVRYSSVNVRILDILVREGVIQGFQVKGNDIVVALSNSEIARQKLKNIRAVSNPSKQVYARLRVLRNVYTKLGVSINSLTLVSTNSGITTIGEAVREGLGGEVLFAANAFVVEAITIAK